MEAWLAGTCLPVHVGGEIRHQLTPHGRGWCWGGSSPPRHHRCPSCCHLVVVRRNQSIRVPELPAVVYWSNWDATGMLRASSNLRSSDHQEGAESCCRLLTTGTNWWRSHGHPGGRGVGGVQWRERLKGGGLEVWSDRPSLVSSDMKNLWRRSPALASLVWRGLYCRQLENIRSTSETNSPEEEEQERKEEER